MFRIQSQAELLECFRISERDQVELPESSRFPIVVKDYFSWVEPSGAKAFLVFSDTGGKNALGVIFRRGSGSGLSMCDWCHSVGEGEVALLTAAASSTRRVGVHVCSDLTCADKIRATVDTGFQRRRIQDVLARMTMFVRQNLF